MIFSLLLMGLGFASLYYGAEWLVEGAINLALILKISKVVVGLVLVAFGTSSPELFVNLIAATEGRTGFALSNVSGSNLTNLCIGFGMCALVGFLVIDKRKFGIDLIFFSASPLLIWLFMVFSPANNLPRWSAIPLLILFAVYLGFIQNRSRAELHEEEGLAGHSLGRGLLLFSLGLLLLYAGGEMVVRSAVNIGMLLGISETVLGLTVVAFGTSIPDTMASIAAVRKGETDIAVGNLLGSNIFNILLVLAATLVFSGHGLVIEPFITLDYAAVWLSAFFFIILIAVSPRLSRGAGLSLIALYLAYIAYRVWITVG
jgi:cation:H+ antiporter